MRRLLLALSVLAVAVAVRAGTICPSDIDAIRSPACPEGNCTTGELLAVQADGTLDCTPAPAAGVTDAQYLVLAAHAGLTVERVWTEAPGMDCTDGGAGGTYTCNAIGLQTPGGTFKPTDNTLTTSRWLKLDGVGTIVGLDYVAHSFMNANYHTDTDTAAATRGQTIAANTSNIWAVVAPNTTTTRKWYRATGDGVNGGVPAWDTFVAGDLGSGTADSTKYLRGDQTWQTFPAAGPHDLLSATHSDTLASAVSRGSLIYGNSTPAWAELAIGAADTFLKSDGTDVSWSTVSASVRWDQLLAPTAAVSMVSGDLLETLTFDFQGAFITGAQALIKQSTGNPLGGTLFQVQTADADVKVFAAYAQGTSNGIELSAAGLLAKVGTGSIQADDVACTSCTALTTETSGDYVATVTGGAGLTGSGSGEGSTPTLAVGAGTCITANADDVALATSCAQDETWTGAHDYSGARLEAPNATSTTGTDCDAAGEAGRVFVDTDEAVGHKVKVCGGAGGWENVDKQCLSWVMYTSCVASGATNCTVTGAGCTQITNIGAVGSRSPALLVDFDTFTHCRLRYTGNTSGAQTGTVTVKLRNYSTAVDDITTSFVLNTTCADRSSAVTDLSANAGLDSIGVQLGDSVTTDDPSLSGVLLTCCNSATVP